MAELISSRAWLRADLESDVSWQLEWTPSLLDALKTWATADMVAAVQNEPTSLNYFVGSAPEKLIEFAQEIRTNLIDGAGLCLVKGYSLLTSVNFAQAAVGFVAFGALVGMPRRQNAAGHLLGHVVDVGLRADDPTVRIYQTNQRQSFHTDSTDAVALLCVRPAPRGGLSLVANAEAAYRLMVQRDPALAKRMFDPVATDRRGEHAPDQNPWFEIPVLTWSGDRLTCIYQRQYIESAARFDDAPRLDPEHRSALDLFDEILNDPLVHAPMQFESGDMQFVHNHSLLHDRTAFEDHADPGLRRHLLRLWLSLPGDRELAPSFAQRYGSVTVGDRGGISVGDDLATISLVP